MEDPVTQGKGGTGPPKFGVEGTLNSMSHSPKVLFDMYIHIII